MDIHRLEYLYSRCIDGECTPEERQELMVFLERPENDVIARQILRRAYHEPKDTVDMAQEDALSVISAIFQAERRNRENTAGSAAPVLSLLRRTWKYAAAVILVLAAAGGYFILRTPRTGELASASHALPPETVVPGGNKAILTLADGSTIILDSAANGALVSQGGVKVMKLADGKVVYHSRNTGDRELLYNTMRTPRGGQYRLVLSDGSEVWLNAGSSIRYPAVFSGNERKVEMTGEAYFEIAKNPQRPFKVSVNGMEVEVMGTHFNINAYDDEQVIKTTLVEGSVKVTASNGGSVLEPGQQAQLAPNRELKILDNADIEQVLAWKNGLFRFNGTNIEAVMRQVARWYDVEVIYEVPTGSLNFSGVVSVKDNISHILKILELAGLHLKMEGRKITVMQ